MHKTRIDNLATIMLDGIGTSNASRKIVGLKCDAGEVSHDGGRCAPLDFFIGCSIEIKALAAAVRRYHRIGGNNLREVVTGSPESTKIPVRLSSVTFQIPSCQLDQWRDGLRDCLSECIEKHGGHLSRKTQKKAKNSSGCSWLTACFTTRDVLVRLANIRKLPKSPTSCTLRFSKPCGLFGTSRKSGRRGRHGETGLGSTCLCPSSVGSRKSMVTP